MSWLIEAYLEEAKGDSKEGLPETIDFFGKKFKLTVPTYYENDKKVNENLSIVKSAIKAFCSAGLYSYLVKVSGKWMNDINNDPYYEGKTCKTGKDLIDAIKNNSVNANKGFAIFVSERQNVLNVFICGEYWLDEEHGFSINFPNGKIVKYSGDALKYNEYKYTGLNLYDSAL